MLPAAQQRAGLLWSHISPRKRRRMRALIASGALAGGGMGNPQPPTGSGIRSKSDTVAAGCGWFCECEVRVQAGRR